MKGREIPNVVNKDLQKSVLPPIKEEPSIVVQENIKKTIPKIDFADKGKFNAKDDNPFAIKFKLPPKPIADKKPAKQVEAGKKPPKIAQKLLKRTNVQKKSAGVFGKALGKLVPTSRGIARPSDGGEKKREIRVVVSIKVDVPKALTKAAPPRISLGKLETHVGKQMVKRPMGKVRVSATRPPSRIQQRRLLPKFGKKSANVIPSMKIFKPSGRLASKVTGRLVSKV